ncbi:MAG: hypothetical protein ACI9OJ_002926, partial [Myxococcota bacterium]
AALLIRSNQGQSATTIDFEHRDQLRITQTETHDGTGITPNKPD